MIPECRAEGGEQSATGESTNPFAEDVYVDLKETEVTPVIEREEKEEEESGVMGGHVEEIGLEEVVVVEEVEECGSGGDSVEKEEDTVAHSNPFAVATLEEIIQHQDKGDDQGQEVEIDVEDKEENGLEQEQEQELGEEQGSVEPIPGTGTGGGDSENDSVDDQEDYNAGETDFDAGDTDGAYLNDDENEKVSNTKENYTPSPSSSNPFDSEVSTPLSTSNNPFADIGTISTSTTTVRLPIPKIGRKMPSPVALGNNPSPKSSIPIPSPRMPRNYNSNSERNLVNTPIAHSRTELLRGSSSQSCSNLGPVPSPKASSGSTRFAFPVVEGQPIQYEPDEIKLIKMGFVKNAVAGVCQNQTFYDALASFTSVILENIRFQRAIKHLYIPPLAVRVGSWMPSQRGSSNHILFYLKVDVSRSGSYSYKLEKTYKDFLKLRKALASPIFRIIPSGLAHKFVDNSSWFKNDTENVLDERREMLNSWLSGICALPELLICEKIHDILFDFLCYDDNVDVKMLL
jgi:hypothetical protein